MITLNICIICMSLLTSHSFHTKSKIHSFIHSVCTRDLQETSELQTFEWRQCMESSHQEYSVQGYFIQSSGMVLSCLVMVGNTRGGQNIIYTAANVTSFILPYVNISSKGKSSCCRNELKWVIIWQENISWVRPNYFFIERQYLAITRNSC